MHRSIAAKPTCWAFFFVTAIFGVLCSNEVCRAEEDATNRSGTRPTNIVLIFADDLGYECFGCYGGISCQTPHIDRLARDGVRFNHCYAQPLCTPSRVKLMTGMYNFRNYTEFARMDPNLTTFGQIFRQAGYATCLFDKWQLGPQRPDHFGFDEYACHGPPATYWGQKVDQKDSAMTLPKDVYGPDYFTDRLLDFIERHQSDPFFAYYPTWLGHGPFQPTPASRDADCTDKQTNFVDMVEYLDRVVGRIVKRLEELGLREETLLLFTADNGTNKSRTLSMADGRTIQGGKGLMTDAGTRVPLIANWPGTIPPGQVSDTMIDLADFLPTMLDAAKVAPPDGIRLDGQSFLPQMLGESTVRDPYAFCWFHHYDFAEGENQIWIRDQTWKLYADGRLYHVPDDVLEEHPVPDASGIAEAEAARTRLQAMLNHILNSPNKATPQ